MAGHEQDHPREIRGEYGDGHEDGLEPVRSLDLSKVDSVDALEIIVALQKEFGVKIRSHEIPKDVFASVASLTRYVQQRMDEGSRSA